jgi:hypothetical protein
VNVLGSGVKVNIDVRTCGAEILTAYNTNWRIIQRPESPEFEFTWVVTSDKYCEIEGNECDEENPSWQPYFVSSYKPEELWRGETCDLVLLEAFKDSELSEPYR